MSWLNLQISSMSVDVQCLGQMGKRREVSLNFLCRKPHSLSEPPHLPQHYPEALLIHLVYLQPKRPRSQKCPRVGMLASCCSVLTSTPKIHILGQNRELMRKYKFKRKYKFIDRITQKRSFKIAPALVYIEHLLRAKPLANYLHQCNRTKFQRFYSITCIYKQQH